MSPRPRLPLLDPRAIRDHLAAHQITHKVLAELIGVDVVAVQTYLYRPISWSLADRIACALGLHPAELWGDDWWAVARAYEELPHAGPETWGRLERSWRQWCAQQARNDDLRLEAAA